MAIGTPVAQGSGTTLAAAGLNTVSHVTLANIAVGDLIYALFSVTGFPAGTATATDTFGNTYTTQGEGGNSVGGVWDFACIVTTAIPLGSIITFTQPNSTAAGKDSLVTSVSGIGSASPDPVSNDLGFHTGTTNTVSTTGAQAVASSIVFAAVMVSVLGTTYTNSAGYTQINTGGSSVNSVLGLAYKIVSTSAVQTNVWSFSASRSSEAILKVFGAGSAISGTGAATLVLAGAGTGARGNAGTGAATLALLASASGTFIAPVTGTGAATLVLGASATGARGVLGSGASTLVLIGLGAGSTVTGTASATLKLTASAAGTVSNSGIGSATLILGASASGTVATAGRGAATLILTGAGAGSVAVVGVGSATLTITGDGTGTASLPPSAGKPHDVAIGLGDELFRRQLNARLPNYGNTLPDIGDMPDGYVFGVGSQLYQAQNGVWVAMS